MSDYNPEILALAAPVLIFGIVFIIFRTRIAKASNGTYKGAGVDRLVFAERRLEKGMVIAGVVCIVLSIGLAISGFFI